MTTFTAALFERHEGRRSTVYKDSRGIATIGVGRNLEGKGLSDSEIDLLRDNDLAEADTDLRRIFGADLWERVDPIRQAALTDLRANLGYAGFRLFSHLINSVLDGDWPGAADNLLDSRLAHMQEPARAQEDAAILRTGQPPSWWVATVS